MGEDRSPTDLTKEMVENLVISQKRIKDFKPNDLVEINIHSKLIGPIQAKVLNDLIDAHNIDSSNVEVKCINEMVWKPLFEHPQFQRRKAKLVQAETLTDIDDKDSFLVLSQGKKIGPINKEEMFELIKQQSILFTDYVSFDKGFSWIHIYDLEDFDRRRKKEDDLPPPPKTDSGKIDLSNRVDEMESIISLIEIGKKEKHDEPISPTTIKVAKNKKSIIGLLSIILVFIVLFKITIDFFESKPKAKSRASQPKKQARPFIKATKQVENYGQKPSRFDSQKINTTKTLSPAPKENEEKEERREEETFVDPYDEIVKESEKEEKAEELTEKKPPENLDAEEENF